MKKIKKALHKAGVITLKVFKATFCCIAVLLGAVNPDVVNNAETPEDMDRLIEEELFGKREGKA